MTTAGTSTFNLDLNDLVEEAFERAGLELRTGYDLRTARRSLNLMTIEWANRGINLWTIEQGQIVMATGQATYALPVNTIDLLDQVIRTNNGTTNQSDINISRISESTYSTIPNKLTQGRPIQVWINRQTGQSNPTTSVTTANVSTTDTTITLSTTSGLASAGFISLNGEIIGYANVDGNQLINCARGQAGTTTTAHTTGASVTVQNLPCVNVWPTPAAPGDQYVLVYWRMRRVQDAGTGVTDQDIPFRFLPCMVAGLAYYVAMKKPEVDGNRVLALKAAYEEQFQLAADEDRDKAPARFVPRNLFYA
jgi:hypothetical protein